jgi:hypothetical protein
MTEPYVKAPGWRRVAGGLVDAAILWPLARGNRLARLPVAVLAEILREQVGSPGQLLLGIRTLDRRSGERVALWRSVVLGGVAWGGQLLAHRLAPPPPGPEQKRALERYWSELRETGARHAEDADASGEARRPLVHPPPVTVNIGRVVAPTVAVGLVTNRLRRLLAPTVEALARRP